MRISTRNLLFTDTKLLNLKCRFWSLIWRYYSYHLSEIRVVCNILPGGLLTLEICNFEEYWTSTKQFSPLLAFMLRYGELSIVNIEAAIALFDNLPLYSLQFVVEFFEQTKAQSTTPISSCRVHFVVPMPSVDEKHNITYGPLILMRNNFSNVNIIKPLYNLLLILMRFGRMRADLVQLIPWLFKCCLDMNLDGGYSSSSDVYGQFDAGSSSAEANLFFTIHCSFSCHS